MWNLLRPGIEPVSPALAGKFSSTAPRGVLVPYFYLLFLLWIKILHSTYYTFLLTLTSRNQDRKGNKGKRIKPHFCWAGSLPSPLPTMPLTPTPEKSILYQSNPTLKQCSGVTRAGTGEQEREARIYTGGWDHFMNTLPGYHFQTQKWS